MKETWAKAAAAVASHTPDAFVEAIRPARSVDAKRLLEIAEELEEMARGYLEKAAQLHHDAARNRAWAAALKTAEGR
jgi:hypothetical protein